MKPTATLLLTLLLGIPGYGQQNGWVQSVQSSPSAMLVGSWRGGNFLYTFRPDGTYIYVGAIGGPGLSTRSSEAGSYSVTGGRLILARKGGVITATNGYRQDLGPKTIVYPIAMGRAPNGLAIQLTYPTGDSLFYRVPD